jgi:hypothetical protein
MFSTRDLKNKQKAPAALPPNKNLNSNTNSNVVSLWSAEDELRYEAHGEEKSYECHSQKTQDALQSLTQKSYYLRSQSDKDSNNQHHHSQQTAVTKAYKSSKRSGKKISSKSKSSLKEQIEALKQDIHEFAKKVQHEKELSMQNDKIAAENEEDNEFDIFTMWRWIKTMFSYRLYKSEDIQHMRAELAKHKLLCEEMSQKSNFWKGKICHFVETGQQNWNISDKYFVSLGQTNNLALE